jgi:hypothetical protein
VSRHCQITGARPVKFLWLFWQTAPCLISLIGIPHDFADRASAQIINPLWQGTMVSYGPSRVEGATHKGLHDGVCR